MGQGFRSSQRAKAGGFCEFDASLVYIASSRPTKATKPKMNNFKGYTEEKSGVITLVTTQFETPKRVATYRAVWVYLKIVKGPRI